VSGCRTRRQKPCDEVIDSSSIHSSKSHVTAFTGQLERIATADQRLFPHNAARRTRWRDLRNTFLIAAFAAVASLINTSAFADFYSGEIPVGSSVSSFQIGPTSNLTVDISALGSRDPTICASCYSSYTDNYTVLLFNQSGVLLESVNETNYSYYNLYTSSHGIGAGPVFINVPVGATTLEIESQLYVAGLLGTNGLALSFGDLTIGSAGTISAATPIPRSLPLFVTGLIGLIMIAWRTGRRGDFAKPRALMRGQIAAEYPMRVD
jgi:hypothetical protein